MLLGAANMCLLAEENEWGNVTNYFKDSAYLHARNLYSFFTDRTRDDVSIEDFGHCCMHSELYVKKREALNRRVMHISPGRPTRNETVEPTGSSQLNEVVEDFTAELKAMWEIWISLTDEPDIKHQLTAALNDACFQADDDLNKIRSKILILTKKQTGDSSALIT
jgi:hypothetical protein